jgi:hypothetical protein
MDDPTAKATDALVGTVMVIADELFTSTKF